MHLLFQKKIGATEHQNVIHRQGVYSLIFKLHRQFINWLQTFEATPTPQFWLFESHWPASSALSSPLPSVRVGCS